MSEIYSKNSEILFLYDAHLTNPNGDPDDENRPRFDYDTNRNLVSDVRLKRYIRDYLQNKGKEIFVSKVNDQTVDATERVKSAFGENISNVSEEDILNTFIDVRLFGATIPIKSDNKTKGSSFTFTGPVQFTWGYSLHKSQLVESSSITSTFAGRTESGKGEHGTIGKDWRVKYSLIGFYGLISGWRAQKTKLRNEDVELLDAAIINSLKLITSTRSKIGQKPRLYMRIEYKDSETLLGDLRDLLIITTKEEHIPAQPGDVKVSLEKLMNVLKENKDKIDKIIFWKDYETDFIEESLEDAEMKNLIVKLEV